VVWKSPILKGEKRADLPVKQPTRLEKDDDAHYLIVSVDIPIVAEIVEASREKPFLSLRLDLDPAAIGALMLESDSERAGREQPSGSGGQCCERPTSRRRHQAGPHARFAAPSRFSHRLPNGRASYRLCAAIRRRVLARSRLRKASDSRSTERSAGSSAISASR
jgi:AraC-type transcriptional regulator N-terminus